MARRHRRPPAAVTDQDGPRPERLQRWLDLLVHSKRRKALDDPELSATYMELTGDAREVVKANIDTLLEQLTRMIADGLTRGDFAIPDPVAGAGAVFDATARYHDPVHAGAWSEPDIDTSYENVERSSSRAAFAAAAPAHAARDNFFAVTYTRAGVGTVPALRSALRC